MGRRLRGQVIATHAAMFLDDPHLDGEFVGPGRGQRMNSKNISTDCYSFARGGPGASATSTDRPLPQPETKAQQLSRQQRRRRVELGPNAARCPCARSPILRGATGRRQLTCLFNHLVGTHGQGSWARPSSSSFQAVCTCSSAITSAALHHPDRPATRGLAAFHPAA
jgi:hypothetical protein